MMRRSAQRGSRLLALSKSTKHQALNSKGYQSLASTNLPTQEQVSPAGLNCSPGCKCLFHTGYAPYKQPPPPGEVPHDHEHVNISNENDKEVIRATQNGKPSDILEVVKLHGEDFTEINVATTFHELSKLAAGFSEADKKELQQDPTFQNLIDMVVMGRRRYNVKHLAQILRSLAELDYDNDVIFDRISQHIMDKLHKADAKAITDLAIGLAETEHSPSVILFEAISNRAVELSGEIDSDQKKALEKAFQKLGYEHKKLSSQAKAK